MNEDAEQLWRFLAQVDEKDFLTRCRVLRGNFPGLTDDGSELGNFQNYLRNRLFQFIERMRAGGHSQLTQGSQAQRQRHIERRHRMFVQQVETAGHTRAARSMRFFVGLMISFRESGWRSAHMRPVSTTYNQGGLDHLYDNQRRLRNQGLLPSNLRFKQGELFGELNLETRSNPTDTIRDARLPSNKILLVYFARVGQAAIRVQDSIREYQRAHASWRPNFTSSSTLMQNVLICVAFAGPNGLSYSRWVNSSSYPQKFGVDTCLDFLSKHSMSVDRLPELWNERGPSSARIHPFRVTRLRAAIRTAIAASALREMYSEFIMHDGEVENLFLPGGYRLSPLP